MAFGDNSSTPPAPYLGEGFVRQGDWALPPIIARAGRQASLRFLEFFAVTIRNANTRAAYVHNVAAFLDWCDGRSILTLEAVQPMVIAAYIEHLGESLSRPTVKQHLAAIRKLFDWLVLGHIVMVNPAASVAGPKHVVKKGKTHVLTADEARQLLDSIPATNQAGRRDRALISIMVYAFARVSAVCAMDRRDVYVEGRRTKLRLREKGAKEHVVVAHHCVDEGVHAYIDGAEGPLSPSTPLFRTVDRRGHLTATRMNRNGVFRMVKQRARAAGLSPRVCCHTFRATGITEYMRNGGTIDKAASIAAHESTRTTQLYNRVDDEVSLDEIERIRI